MVTSDLTSLFDIGIPDMTPMSTGILIAILIILLLTLLSTAAYFPVLLSISSYTGINARVKAKGIPYIQEDGVQDLLQSGSAADCINRLKNAGYLTSVNPDCSPDQAEEELLASWYEEVSIMRSQAPRDAWLFFDAVLFFQEIAKVKRVLRLVFMGRAVRITEEPRLWPDGFSADLASKISNTKNIEESIRLFQETRYGTALTQALPLYEKEKSLFFFDHALDCEGYAELKKQASMVQSTLSSPYREFIATIVDIQNVRILMRAKNAGWDPGAIPVCLVEGGLELPRWRLVQLNEMMSLPDLIRQLTGTRYEPLLSPHLRTYPSSDSMLMMDLALDQYLLDTASRLELQYYLAGGPLLYYLVAKDYELRNIRIILTGIIEKIPSDAVSRLLVTRKDRT